jgi:hypothetical protein
MEYAKLDARLCEALSEPSGGPASFEVFIDLDRNASPDDLRLLAALGVSPGDRPSAIMTAQLSRDALSAVSDLPAVRHVTFRRRLQTRG